MPVVTWAMLRTWLVRLPAIRLTLSVRSFQMPATPLTSAWPPSLPSVPTSRATRVTSLAKALSWSTMVLMVCLSSRISPRTSTVIFLERSPCWTAVVTSAMLRTWLVRLPAMKLTLSVRSFQMPATPLTSAWPPRRPSVPTSRATRVTSLAKALSWSTIVLMVCLSSRISPWTSTVIFFDRSPCWTAVVTSAMLRTWLVRLPAMKLTLSVRSFQIPATPLTSAWPPSFPSVPTSRATRVTSPAKALSWSTIVLMVCLSSRISPRTSTVIFFDRSPCWTAVVTSAMLRTWLVRLPAMKLTFSVRSFQMPALGTDLPGHARDLVGEGVELVDHRVDGVLELQDLSLNVDRDLLRQVAVGDAGGDLGDVADLARQIAGHQVDVVGQVFPDARHALNVRLAAQLALGAHLAGDARHLAREGVQLVDHRVDGVLELEDLSADVDGDLLREVTLLDGRRDLGDVAHLAGQVAGHQVHVVGDVLPHAANPTHVRLATELALGAHLARYTRHLAREGVELADHRVHGPGGVQELALERAPVDLQGHGLRQVAVGHRADHARDLGVRAGEVLGQVVDRVEGGRPRASRAPRGRPVDLALLADLAGEAADLSLQALVGLDDRVEGGGDLAPGPRPVFRQACREVAALHGLEHAKHRLGVDGLGAIHGLGPVPGCGPGRHISLPLRLFLRVASHRLSGTQNAILVPFPGSLSMRHQPPASCARSRSATRPMWPGTRTDSATTNPVPLSLTSTRRPPSSSFATTVTRVAWACFSALVRASATFLTTMAWMVDGTSLGKRVSM